MYTFKKTLALFLILSLLGQNTLFAAPAAAPEKTQNPQEAAQPLTLAQYQARAKSEAEKEPWLKKEAMAVLAVGGASVGLLVVQQLRHQRERRAQAEQFEQVTKRLFDRATSAERTLARQEIELWRADAYAKETGKSTLNLEIHQAALEQENKALSSALQKTQRTSAVQAAQLQEWSDVAAADIKGFNHTTQTIAGKLMKNQALSAEEIRLLTEGMSEEVAAKFRQKLNAIAHFGEKAAPQTRRTLVQDLLTTIPKTYPESISYRSVLYIKGILKEMKGLVLVGVLVALTLHAQDVRAQKMAGRINANFNLFLDATPEELARLEKDDDLRQLCIQGAEALHLMSLLPEEEKKSLKEAFAPAPARTGAQEPFNLAY